MKKIITILVLSLPLTIFSSTLVILECELIENGTIEDVKRINSAWVKSVNELNDKQVSSQVLEAVLSENMEGFIRILELIKVYFKNVLLISHLDSLKDCVDMQIVIDKKAGYAKVNQ